VVDVDLDALLSTSSPTREATFDLLARQHAPGVQHEFLQQIELLRLQVDRLPAVDDRPRRGIEPQPALLQDRRRFAARAADERAQPRRELVEIDGLENVVVGAGVEALDAIPDGVAGGRTRMESGCPPRPPFRGAAARPAEAVRDRGRPPRTRPPRARAPQRCRRAPNRRRSRAAESGADRVAEQRIVSTTRMRIVRLSVVPAVTLAGRFRMPAVAMYRRP
jgi:hypothetical protein